MSVVGPTEARPGDGLAVDFVVESDRAQLGEIVQRVRDGRLRTNIGNVATLDDAVAAFNPTERMQREDDHPPSSVRTLRERQVLPSSWISVSHVARPGLLDAAGIGGRRPSAETACRRPLIIDRPARQGIVERAMPAPELRR